MPPDSGGTQRYRFGAFVLDVRDRELRRQDVPVPLTPKVFDTLLVLVENAGHVVDKDTLLRRVWPDSFVEEANLAQNVFTLRKALGDTAQEPAYIETVPKRGYRFIQAVRPDEGNVPPTTRRRTSLTIAAAAALVVIASLVAVWHARSGPPPPARIVLLVLPFENLTGDPGQEFFSDGLTEELITQVSRLNPRRLAVVARTSSMAFKGSRKPISEIARVFGADYVLEGGARRSGDRVRITAQLIETKGQTHLWSETYERRSADLVEIQADVAHAVGREIRVELAPDQASASQRRHAVDEAAHELYLRGRHQLTLGTETDVREAARLFKEAIARDPSYAQPYAGVSMSVVALTDYYVAPGELGEEGRSAADKAIALDDGLAEAHTALGAIYLMFDWRWADAEAEFRRAVQLAPEDPDAHSWYGYHLVLMGRFDEAIDQVRQAQAVDPLSPAVHLNAAWVYYLARRPADAADQLHRALEIDPHPSVTHSSLWVMYAPVADFVSHANIDAQHATLLGRAALAGLEATAGRRSEAERDLAALKDASVSSYVCPYEMAAAYASLRNATEAFRYLDESYRNRSVCLPELRVDPRFDSVRNDPRYRALMQQLAFPPGS